jgi:hypothetical protein
MESIVAQMGIVTNIPEHQAMAQKVDEVTESHDQVKCLL